ncbi:hypothetical protein [Bacillus norwichensis]|uniref:Lipoprotein n=1 Tax=Bacillus norwichensis TaxID=2762217 RepID=A0ABR8VQI2_9BACI|nr:hypothetical protein [Bacillus norwichensis]MBD8007017.1 hypothetical protein [Bacillus norwichensis]
MKKMILYTLAALIFSGCAQKLPDPEAEKAKAMETEVKASKQITVRHNVQGNSIYIECFIPGISFSPSNAGGQLGKALLYVDGQLYNEYDTAAFVVKDLSSGVHTFTIEIVDKDNKSLGISQKFKANVS